MTSPRLLVPLCALAISCGGAAQKAPPPPEDGGADAAMMPGAPADGGGADRGGADGGVAPADVGAGAGDDARPDVRLDALGTLDVSVAGPCGSAFGPVCPATYMGTQVIVGRSTSGIVATMAPDEAVYLCGAFNEPTDFDPTPGMDVRVPAGQSDGFITRLGPGGTYGYTRTFPGGDFERADVEAASASTTAVFALGGFEGSIDLDPGPGVDARQAVDPMSAESYLVKLTAAGVYVWGRTLDNTSTLGASWGHVAAAADGSLIVSGGYTGRADLDPGPDVHLAPNGQGAFVSRLDANGAFSWARTLGGDACQRVDVDGFALAPDGSAWFGGSFDGTCVFDQNGPGTAMTDSGLFVASIGPDGKVRTFATILGSVSLGAMSVASDGSVYVAGSAGSSVMDQDGKIDFDPSPAVVARTAPFTGVSFVLKLDANGAFQWVQLLPSDGSLFLNAIAATPDNGVLVAAGQTGLPLGMLILKLAADQHEAWRFHAGTRDTVPYALFADAKGFVVVGDQRSPADLDPSAAVDIFTGGLIFVSRYVF